MKRKPLIAAGLQCAPLLLAALWGGELTHGWFRLGNDFFYFWLVICSWGLGQVYLHRWQRFLATWVAGFAITAVAGLAALLLVLRCGSITSLVCRGFRPEALLLIVIVGGSLICAIDGWRTAAAMNAAIARAGRRRRGRRR
jgi:hypothetical protein